MDVKSVLNAFVSLMNIKPVGSTALQGHLISLASLQDSHPPSWRFLVRSCQQRQASGCVVLLTATCRRVPGQGSSARLSLSILPATLVSRESYEK